MIQVKEKKITEYYLTIQDKTLPLKSINSIEKENEIIKVTVRTDKYESYLGHRSRITEKHLFKLTDDDEAELRKISKDFSINFCIVPKAVPLSVVVGNLGDYFIDKLEQNIIKERAIINTLKKILSFILITIALSFVVYGRYQTWGLTETTAFTQGAYYWAWSIVFGSFASVIYFSNRKEGDG